MLQRHDTGRKVLVWIYQTPEHDAAPRVLVLKRAPPRAREWHPVTGHAEPGESLEQAAAREAVEETGCDPASVVDLDYRYGFTRDVDGARQAFEEHAFAIRADGEACTLSHEHEAFEWVPLNEAGPMLQFPEQRAALKCLADRLGVPVPWGDD